MSLLHIDMTQIVEILPQLRQGPTYSEIVSIMGGDVLATQGARPSATMILTWLNQDNSVPAHKGFMRRAFHYEDRAVIFMRIPTFVRGICMKKKPPVS